VIRKEPVDVGEWGDAIRDCDGTFGLNPRQQDLVGSGVEPPSDLVNRFVDRPTRLARDRSVLFVTEIKTSEYELEIRAPRRMSTYVNDEYASETMPWAAVYARSGAWRP
jgi:hypothetical protein